VKRPVDRDGPSTKISKSKCHQKSCATQRNATLADQDGSRQELNDRWQHVGVSALRIVERLMRRKAA
jgi:hypothetical protein